MFLGTAIDSVDQIPGLQIFKLLDVPRGRAILQLMEAFRPVRDKVAAFNRNLVNVLNAGRSSLVVEALSTYDMAKILVRYSSNTDQIACVDTMRRALGRAREKKT